MSESTQALGETTTAIAFDHTFTYAYINIFQLQILARPTKRLGLGLRTQVLSWTISTGTIIVSKDVESKAATEGR